VNGVPVGERIDSETVPLPGSGLDEGAGSIIVLIATDAPLLPIQCERLARRAAFGVARTGGMGEHSSGDFGLCFATGNRAFETDEAELPLRDAERPRIKHPPIRGDRSTRSREVDPERAAGGRAMTGRNGANTAHALPHDLLLEALSR
jgi:D-aminopeptidase